MESRNKTVALVVAAGSGTRAGGGLPKQFVPIAGKPLLTHAIDRLAHERIDEIRVVIRPGQEDPYHHVIGNRRLSAPVAGGETRQQSVRNGLEALASEGGAATVLIHDAARPFLPPAVIGRLLDALETSDGAVPVLPVVDSMARASDELGDTVGRENLVRVQTPQAFCFDGILNAHRLWSGPGEATDDAQVARAAGLRIATVQGDPLLDKLTYPKDFVRAEQRLSSALISRTGLGFDVHAFTEDEELWLGGLLIPHERGLSGHSDADVVLHSVTDAILGAIGAGDIGDHFPPSDPQWRGARSARFVEYARELVQSRGGCIDHVDITIICEAPRIGPHRQAMREAIAEMLGVPLGKISVKATTTERLGFTGRGEGIAAKAIATVRLPEER